MEMKSQSAMSILRPMTIRMVPAIMKTLLLQTHLQKDVPMMMTLRTMEAEEVILQESTMPNPVEAQLLQLQQIQKQEILHLLEMTLLTDHDDLQDHDSVIPHQMVQSHSLPVMGWIMMPWLMKKRLMSRRRIHCRVQRREPSSNEAHEIQPHRATRQHLPMSRIPRCMYHQWVFGGRRRQSQDEKMMKRMKIMCCDGWLILVWILMMDQMYQMNEMGLMGLIGLKDQKGWMGRWIGFDSILLPLIWHRWSQL